MKAPLSRVSLSVQILLMALVFVAGLMGALSAILQKAVLEGSTKITVEVNEAMIKAAAEDMAVAGLLSDLPALEGKLGALRERNSGLESLFVSDGGLIVAASEPGKAGSLLGGGAIDKGSEIRAVLASGQASSEIEQRTDIIPRLTYIYPIPAPSGPRIALVAKFSLEEEFGAITHLREALYRILLLSGIVGAPALFGLLWLMAIGPLRRLRRAAAGLAEGDFDLSLPAAHSLELSGLSTALASASASIKAQYERYLSPQVVAILRKEGGFRRDIRMKTTAAILMCDIEGLTSLSEGLTVDDLGLFLNGYFRTMTEIIFARRGTLDKYMGDGILAIFGAPLPTAEFRQDAIEAAREMTSAYARDYRTWLPAPLGAGAPASRIRVGIATGEVFYGNVGYAKRSDFTALGRSVNLAARLQELNKETSTTILIDLETARGLAPGDRSFRPAGSLPVRGFQAPVEVLGSP